MYLLFQESVWSEGEKIMQQIQQRQDAEQDKPQITSLNLRKQQHGGWYTKKKDFPKTWNTLKAA